jgi:hypothetical protein
MPERPASLDAMLGYVAERLPQPDQTGAMGACERLGAALGALLAQHGIALDRVTYAAWSGLTVALVADEQARQRLADTIAAIEQVQQVRADDVRRGDTVIGTAGERYYVSDIETYRDDAGTWLRLIDEAYDRCLEWPPGMPLPVVRAAHGRHVTGEPAEGRCTCRSVVPDA